MKTAIDNDHLGSVVKSARQSKHLTQYRLAEQLGITPRYLKAIENSGQKPSYDLLTRLIRELDLSPDAIFSSGQEWISAKIYILQSGETPVRSV
jgi:transcriptional regulator with XRE-family HTH domain